MGTTIVACRFREGVVVGADTRTSVSGYVSNRFAHKISPLFAKCVVCRSGSAADTQELVHVAKWELEHKRNRHGTSITVSQAAHLLKNLAKKSGRESTSLICTGYDNVLQRGVIYSISPSGSLVEEPTFCVSGSGSVYILGRLDSFSRQMHDMEEQEAIAFMLESIQLAMDRDASSGGLVRILVITAEGQRVVTWHPGQQLDTGTKESTTMPSSSRVVLPGFALPTTKTQ